MSSQTTQAGLDCLPVMTLRGVGAKLAETLAKCNIRTVQDVLFHLPLRYQDRTRITALRDVKPLDYCVIEGAILSTRLIWGKRSSLTCDVADPTGRVQLRFFHFSGKQQAAMKTGAKIRCFGEVRRYRNETIMIHPEYRIMQADETMAVDEHLTPIYPTTDGLGQKSIRQLIQQALTALKNNHLLQELLPADLREQYQLPDLKVALEFVHAPPPDAKVSLLLEGTHPMQQRLAFEELIAHQLGMRRLRHQIQQQAAPVFDQDSPKLTQFEQQLPFTLTNAQLRVVDDIFTDMTKPYPMLRLIQGDVGSGKTIVALLAILKAVDHGYQGALMAPTEVLAEQHYRNFQQLLSGLDIIVVFLSGKLKSRDKNYALSAMSGGQAHIAIGTHALFQKDVTFHHLGLVVIDEQHRFGVHQRLALRDKGAAQALSPHQLVMTATPIPRTLAMTAYADMDHSIIDELPPGRTPVKTVALPNTRRDDILERVRDVCLQKHQVYWVCTLIEESEVLQCQAAEDTLATLQITLPDLRVGLVHGRLGSNAKEEIMSAFKSGEVDLLVATTVIEVGVDVPNASLMIIENPERLGLSQLHQLRGRVGRGQKESHCVLLYQPNLTQQATARLAIMRETTDGFKIAQCDLNLRGPGEVLGTRQTGMARFKVADLMRDKDLLDEAKSASRELEKQPLDCQAALIKRWLGDNEQYGSA